MGQTVLEMKGIKKSFSGVYALSGIDFSLEQGEVHALLGENGAGKSTLIKVLGGIYQPDEGSIFIRGKEVRIRNVPEARANGIGIIHQEIVLVPYLTVAQNLFLGRDCDPHRLSEARQRRLVDRSGAERLRQHGNVVLRQRGRRNLQRYLHDRRGDRVP